MNIIRLLLIGGLIYFAMMQKKESTRNMILIVTGLLAVCIQHEIDHLDGKLFVVYLSSLKRSRLKKKINKDATLASKTI